MYPGLNGRCKQQSSGPDIGWSLNILEKNSRNDFFKEKIKHLFSDESVSVLSCSPCTEGNIEKELKDRDGLDYTEKEHKIVLRNGDFKVQCKNQKHKFFLYEKLMKNLDLKCDEDNSQSSAITIDFKHSQMPECLGKIKTHTNHFEDNKRIIFR